MLEAELINFESSKGDKKLLFCRSVVRVYGYVQEKLARAVLFYSNWNFPGCALYY